MKKLVQLDVFTDEWKFLFVYCNEAYGKRLSLKLFPDVSKDYDFTNRRGLTFFKRNKVPMIWINSDKVKGKQKLYTAIHESTHLVKCIGDWVGITDEEWFAETMEYAVKQIVKSF